ncbi:acyltransferase family protein [Chitinimonas sp. JJ19]|uniref:acyltransferase family protein n=1 Tax=Chitinimonas sp. JJ19 TaxID=3109352 RepID=UPI001A3B8039|nr:acyltransferase [Chitinimonas sp.]
MRDTLRDYERAGVANNFGLLRLLAAMLVLLSHAWPLSGNPAEYLSVTVGLSFGTVAVNVFFAVSGFLVCGSYLRNPKLGGFLWRRGLRLFPGLVVAAVVAPALAFISSGLDASAYFASIDFARFVGHNASLLGGVQYSLHDAFAGNPAPRAINGSLWTLPYECTFYLACASLGWLGVLGNRVAFNLGFAAVIVLFAAGNPSADAQLPGLLLSFLLGAFFQVNAEQIRMKGLLALLTLLVFYLVFRQVLPMVCYYFALTYGVLWLAYCAPVPLPGWFDRQDYSYGVYLYAFPMQQLAAWWLAPQGGLSVANLVWLPLIGTLVLACLSWNLVEKPAQRFKNQPWQGWLKRGGLAGKPSLSPGK